MYYVYAGGNPLVEIHDPSAAGTSFQTKSFSNPCNCRYRITGAGRSSGRRRCQSLPLRLGIVSMVQIALISFRRPGWRKEHLAALLVRAQHQLSGYPIVHFLHRLVVCLNAMSWQHRVLVPTTVHRGAD